MQPFNYDESMEVYRSASHRIDVSNDYYYVLPVGGFQPTATFRLLCDAVVYADMLAGKVTDDRAYHYQYDVVCSNIAKYTDFDEIRGALDVEIWSATDDRVILSVWSNDRLTLQRVIHDNASEYAPFIEYARNYNPY